MATPTKLLALGLVLLAPAALANTTPSMLPSQILPSDASVTTSAMSSDLVVAASPDSSQCSDDDGDYPTITGFWPVQTGPSGKIISGDYAPGGGSGSGSGSGNGNGSGGGGGNGYASGYASGSGPGNAGNGRSGGYTNGTSTGSSGGRGGVSPSSSAGLGGAAVAPHSGAGRMGGSAGVLAGVVFGLLMLL